MMQMTNVNRLSLAEKQRKLELEGKALALINRDERDELVHLRALEAGGPGKTPPAPVHVYPACLAETADPRSAVLVVRRPIESPVRDVRVKGVRAVLREVAWMTPAEHADFTAGAEEAMAPLLRSVASSPLRLPRDMHPVEQEQKRAAHAKGLEAKARDDHEYWSRPLTGAERFDVRAVARAAGVFTSENPYKPPVDLHHVASLADPYLTFAFWRAEQDRALAEAHGTEGRTMLLHSPSIVGGEEVPASVFAEQLRQIAMRAMQDRGVIWREVETWWKANMSTPTDGKEGGA